MYALLFQRSDDTLDHAVLLWAMRRDELLAQAVAARGKGVALKYVRDAVRTPSGSPAMIPHTTLDSSGACRQF